MREEDAKKKECRNSGLGSTNGTGHPYDYAFPGCSGSKCMNWRWAEAFDIPGNDHPLGGTNYDTEGYCGLAGKE